MAFENANLEFKRVIRTLKDISAPKDEWIRNIADIGFHIYDTWRGKMIFKNFKKNQKVRCSTCGKPGHLIVDKVFLETVIPQSIIYRYIDDISLAD